MPPLRDNALTLWLIAGCLLFGIHINFENTGGTGLELPYNNFSWIFLCLILSSSLWHLAKFKQWKQDNSLVIIGVIIVAISLPILFQEIHSTSSAGLRVLGIVSGLLITLLCFQNFRTQALWINFLYILVFAGSLEALHCLVQQYLPNIAEYGVYKADYGRPFGSFQQPNVSASFIASGLAASLYLLVSPSLNEQRKRPLIGTLSLSKHYLLPISALLSAIALPLLGSRTGLLSALIVSIFALPMLINSLSIPQKRKPVIVWLLALFIGLGISLSSIQNMSSGGRNIESFQSTDNRQGIYAQSFDMIQEKPLTGWGYGNFEAAFLNYYAEKYANGEYKHAVVQNLDHPHNELLLWAVEGGIIPPLLLICFSLYLIYRVFSNLNFKHGLLALGLIIPLSVHANTEYPFYQSISHWLVFSVLIAFLLWLSRPIQTSDNSRVFKLPFFAKSFALLIPLIAIPLLLVNLQAIYQVTKFHKHRANDIRHLEEVIYPGSIWKRFFFDVMTLKLKASMKDKDRAGLQSYIQWGQAFVQHTPRSAIYLNMANAFWTLGAPEQSIKTLERAVYLYPQDKHLQQILNSTQKNWQNYKRKQKERTTDTKKQPK